MTTAHQLLAVDLKAWTPEDWSAAATVATAIFTIATVGIALAAALYAKQQVDLARQLREDQAQPFVVVDFADNPVWGKAIDFVVENMGQTLARNVKIKIDPPFQTTMDNSGHPLASSPLLTQAIPSMPPGKRITALFDIAHERYDAGLPTKYTATIEFEDAHGKRQEPLTYILDLSIRYDLLRMTEYRTHDAAKALREISATLKETGRDIRGEFRRRRESERNAAAAGGGDSPDSEGTATA
ncbi:hypothetical protein N8I84_24765 [Streptomyces cynarae]|uniref:Uncharacterized protein n=1 Tax=Streptomyces cynarae TaxID=2981134 RepID=A0ABY6E583_9ACTN|nr:hypothetical protein [Streptomyces cynarae]UXY21543.1 hypothetical protein N8I84_24765 [Streptomyces cynarae]